MTLADVKLDDKYLLDEGRIYVSGVQALVRLLIMQRQRDSARGLNTAGFVSGYRGSPLGGLDKELWKAKSILERHHVRFQPGLNEDLGATAVWGSQQVNMFAGARYDGVFGLWYGKGPGVDRTGDVFKHANAAGTSHHGGVLAVAGDDHGCKSSTLPHQSEFAFMDAMMPVLNPAGVQEILDLGLMGFALSRYSGCWVGFKTIAENVDSSASVSVDPARTQIVLPDFQLPPDGLHIRWPDKPLTQELRLQKHKLYAAIAFARANNLNRIVVDSAAPRFGIITTGKSYLDVLQALDDLGIDQALATQIGLRVLKVGMSWPLDREGIRQFAEGLEEVLVVEEKRAVIENQLKEQLYNWRADVRPRVIGKFDENESWILPSTGELTPARIARVIAERIDQFFTSTQIRQRLAFLEAKEASLQRLSQSIERVPHYCSGCPHNTSTQVPEGSRAMGGIGCHYMATWMDRRTETFTQMGGEGVPWIGQAPFTSTPHVFQNLGDGTYFHSGVLAIRAAVAAGVNITYKILYNEAVAMTGGQPVDGMLSVVQLTHQLRGEGVERICVVSDTPDKYGDAGRLAQGASVHHRDALERLQLELREVSGVSVLVYDQTCAAEKRRRRKRGVYPDPAHRVVINAAVCEGCGDCGTQSNCLSVVPVETELGRKRAIDQHACNKDLSCLKGFCPSFVSVLGGRLRKPAAAPHVLSPPPRAPRLADCDTPYGIAITGVGGTGVVTVSALLGMAAHIEGKACTVLDMTGLAQKYGAVVSHVRICERPEALHAPRISAGRANLLLGCDLVVAAGFEALAKCTAGETHAVVNDHASMTAAFLRQPDLGFPGETLRQAVDEATGGQCEFLDATELGRWLVGDPVTANLLLLGYAYQRGLVPLSAAAIERAVEINGAAVAENKSAFEWGRRLADDPQTVHALAPAHSAKPATAPDLESLVSSRVAHLTAYQNEKLAARYRTLVQRVRSIERRVKPGDDDLALAVAQSYAKLLAYKDEYEVARLLTEPGFSRRIAEQFEGPYTIAYHLSPPFSGIDPNTGRPKKRRFGQWLRGPLGWLAALRRIRGTRIDPFSYTEERRLERWLIADYEQTIELLLDTVDDENHGLVVEIAGLPNTVRGYGPVKTESVQRMQARKKALLAELRQPPRRQAA